MSVARPPPRRGPRMSVRTWFHRLRVRVRAAVRSARRTRLGRLKWKKGLVRLLAGTTVFAAIVAAAVFYLVYFDRNNLPDLEAFTRFELPTIGHVYDVNGRPFI